MQAVFDSAWQRLNLEEQMFLLQLSLFKRFFLNQLNVLQHQCSGAQHP
jgi:hypothetical protein